MTLRKRIMRWILSAVLLLGAAAAGYTLRGQIDSLEMQPVTMVDTVQPAQIPAQEMGTAAETYQMPTGSLMPASATLVPTALVPTALVPTALVPTAPAATAQGTPMVATATAQESVDNASPAENAVQDATGAQSDTSDVATQPTSRININTATQAQLETLPGIGPVKAAAIIAFREANGAFAQIEHLMRVKGIGEKTLEGVRALVTVE